MSMPPAHPMLHRLHNSYSRRKSEADPPNSEPIPPSTSTTASASEEKPRTKICVFCGSTPGVSPTHLAAAEALAETLHAHKISLVYGGGSTGLMGAIAKRLVSLSGVDAVHGIIPAPLLALERGNSYTSNPQTQEATEGTKEDVRHGGSGIRPGPTTEYGRTTIVPDMHTRKKLMAREVVAGGPGSGFVALSGGFGTLEELMEVVTWNQLGIHNRGICVYNVEGFWDGLLAWVSRADGEGFVREKRKEIIGVAREAEEVIRWLKGYKGEGGLVERWDDM